MTFKYNVTQKRKVVLFLFENLCNANQCLSIILIRTSLLIKVSIQLLKIYLKKGCKIKWEFTRVGKKTL